MSTALLTEADLKFLIIEETDKLYIERETKEFFNFLFDTKLKTRQVAKKLFEIAIRSQNRKLSVISENPKASKKLRKQLKKSFKSIQSMPKPAGGERLAGGFGNLLNQPLDRVAFTNAPGQVSSGNKAARLAAVAQKKADRLAGQHIGARLAATDARAAAKQTGIVRRLLTRLANMIGRPIGAVAKVFKDALGSIASRASGSSIGQLAQRVAGAVGSRLGIIGAAGVAPILFKIAMAALTAYTIYQIGNAAWSYIMPQIALATTDPKSLALMRANTIANAAKNGRFLAGDWANWPKAVQCAFCKQNPGRQKPEVKPGVPVSTGPTCADLAANKICDKVKPPKPPKPPRPGRRGCCATNTKLIKKNPDLGPNVKAGFKELKDLLKAAGFGKGLDSSGKCDRKLCNAIKAFQKANGLTADSLYGPKSHAKMQEVLGKKIKGGKISIVATGIKLNKKTNTYEATATTSDGKSFKGSQPRSGSDDTGDMNVAKAEARDKAKAYIAKK